MPTAVWEICQFFLNSHNRHIYIYGLPWWLRPEIIHLQCRRPGFNPRVGKIPWRRKWQPTPVLLPGESHGLRNLAGWSGVTESRTGLNTCTRTCFSLLSGMPVGNSPDVMEASKVTTKGFAQKGSQSKLSCWKPMVCWILLKPTAKDKGKETVCPGCP